MHNFPSKLSFVDVETTGTSPSRDRIIEIGILRIENNEIIQTYQSLINPQRHVSPFIEAMTGIKGEDVLSAPLFSEIAPDVLEILEGALFIAHNVRFDYEFIKQEFARLGVSYSSSKFCTVNFSRQLYPQFPRHDLDSVIERHGIVCENRHRAFDDAKALWEFIQKAYQIVTPEVFSVAVNHCLKRPSFPSQLPKEKIDSLHEGPGVYIFYGEKGMPLYVGKSIHIKERVVSHFTQNSLSVDMKICKDVTDIEVIPTAGELGALVREAEMVKKLQPLYNRKLRRTHELTAIIKITDEEGYGQTHITTLKTLEPTDTESILAFCKSKRQAVGLLRSICKEYNLCPKLLNLENSQGSCMHHQFGWCKGACKKVENSLSYNLRLSQAFSDTKLVRWPFDGPVEITETKGEDYSESFIIDKWCMVSFNKNSSAYETTSLNFDLDTYKILVRFIRNKKNMKYIKSLSVFTPSTSTKKAPDHY